jgi:F-type H+-transporting ATPase subunit gamma
MAGGTVRILRRRIRTVEATKKITRAFELIAASQIVRAQNRIAANRPYRQAMAEIVREAARADPGAAAGLIGTAENPQRVAVALIVGDRGLSGPYNATVFRAAEALLEEHRANGAETRLVTVGRRAIAYFRFRGRETTESFSAMADRPTYADARQVAVTLWHLFHTGEVEQVQLVSTRYQSAGRQSVEVAQLLPIPEPEIEAEGERPPESTRGGYTEFEPDVATLVADLMPRWLESELFSGMLEASASEHAARQRAMAAATDNAEELVRTLTRTMNQARQDTITNEIMEIVGGAEALREAKGA